MKKILAILLTLVLLCGCTAAMAETRLIIGAGPIGGAFYPIAGGIASIINENVEGVTVNVQVTAGWRRKHASGRAGRAGSGLVQRSAVL